MNKIKKYLTKRKIDFETILLGIFLLSMWLAALFLASYAFAIGAIPIY